MGQGVSPVAPERMACLPGASRSATCWSPTPPATHPTTSPTCTSYHGHAFAGDVAGVRIGLSARCLRPHRRPTSISRLRTSISVLGGVAPRAARADPLRRVHRCRRAPRGVREELERAARSAEQLDVAGFEADSERRVRPLTEQIDTAPVRARAAGRSEPCGPAPVPRAPRNLRYRLRGAFTPRRSGHGPREMSQIRSPRFAAGRTPAPPELPAPNLAIALPLDRYAPRAARHHVALVRQPLARSARRDRAAHQRACESRGRTLLARGGRHVRTARMDAARRGSRRGSGAHAVARRAPTPGAAELRPAALSGTSRTAGRLPPRTPTSSQRGSRSTACGLV